MGYNQSYLWWVNAQVDKVYNSVKNLKMLELGNQLIKKSPAIKETTGKDYYTKLGYDHTSIDLNGLNGALKKDLSNLDDFKEYKKYFNVITNSGTTEHVEPFEGQYNAFLNIHNSLKIGGLAIHIVPDVEFSKPGHAQYYYDLNFYDTLVENSDYTYLDTTILYTANKKNCWRAYAYKKIGDKFIDKKNLLDNIHILDGPVGGMYVSGKTKGKTND